MKRRPIATRYAALVALLLSVALVSGGALETWTSHRDRQAVAEALQREKAQFAAAAVSHFLEDVVRKLDWVTLAAAPDDGEPLARRRLEFVKLLRLEPAITTATLVDRDGRERVRVSRTRTEWLASGTELSHEPGLEAARAGKVHFSDVFFLAQSEPYLTIAVPSAARDGSAVLAEVNLKFVQGVIAAIKLGATGHAYVVDARGRLVSHPDLSLVLQVTDFSRLPQVRAAQGGPAGAQGFVDEARDAAGAPAIAAFAGITSPGWVVFVEQSRAEALAPLVASIGRSTTILLAALALSIAAGVLAARRMVAPIGELRQGAQRFGSGDLAHRIAVDSGDELEELAWQFNAMAARLRESHATLERRVDERTQQLSERNAQLSEALEQQTATADILRVMSASPKDALPVFDSILAHATRLCDAGFAAVFLLQGGRLRCAAHTQALQTCDGLVGQDWAVGRSTAAGRAALEGRAVQIVDVLADAEFVAMPAHHGEGIRTVLAVPLLRHEALVGVIETCRREVRAFSDRQVELLQTFADQAVIAIENHRMFDEIQDKSHQLERADQAKSRFLAAASHDLRQPMHALSLLAGQLRECATPVERAAMTQRIEQGVSSLAELLDQLLDLSRLEAGAVEAVHEDFAIQELLSMIEAEFAPLARAKGIGLRVAPSQAWLRSDALLVRRIVLNLVGNAIRYTDRGGVLVGCRKRGAMLRIAVWDTGCGIPDERRDDVFREFVRLASPGPRPADPQGAGLGLGLAIVARLADLLGARVELRSAVGRGSMFAIELPLGLPSDAARRASVPLPELRGTFALVIDDDPAARDGMCELLQRWGCLTLAAQGGDDAIAQLALHDRPPELIVCDYRLAAQETGVEVIGRVQAAIGDRVPAIVVTGDTSSASLGAARAVGVPLLHKPVSPVKLRALLAKVLSQPAGGTSAV